MIELKTVLGDDLFYKVKKVIADKKLILDDGMLIPKHRFDCINISLREHKEKVHKLLKDNELLKTKLEQTDILLSEMNQLRRESAILNELSKYKIRNFICVKALLDIAEIADEDLVAEIKKQILMIKKNEPYLFYDDDEYYMLIPCKGSKAERKI